MHFWRHFFTPHHTNNYRAKILHVVSLATIVAVFIGFASGVYIFKQAKPDVLGISYSISEQELLESTNRVRQENGAPPLRLSPQLSQAARAKASYMFEKNFWAHFAPDGTTPWSFIKTSGYEYLYAGENLAKGFTNSPDVVSAWMNSPSHKENLLSSKYSDVGFAVQEGSLTGEDTVLVVQLFGEPYVVSSPVANTPSDLQQVAAAVPQEGIIPDSKQVQGQEKVAPRIDSQIFTKSASIVFLLFIITILVLDLVVVERKKIPRIVGHNLDHVIILVLLLVFILLESNTGIL